MTDKEFVAAIVTNAARYVEAVQCESRYHNGVSLDQMLGATLLFSHRIGDLVTEYEKEKNITNAKTGYNKITSKPCRESKQNAKKI